MKKWISIAMFAALTVGTIVCGTVAGLRGRHLKDMRQTVTEQRMIIDSLLKRRMTVVDVKLNVTDKSRFAIYGRYNRGTISVPNERTYTLEIDSFSLKTMK
ncbi:MAG: hypothetical protein IJU33_02280 [Bacteroidales bacterium]|nr:hypothetical protein [Bacteroidales bacterium]